MKVNQINIMNQIPEDIVGLIMSFLYDKRGYHYIDILRRKRKLDFKMNRVIGELKLFHRFPDILTIAALKPNGSLGQNRKKSREFRYNLQNGKPIINYHTGLYTCIEWERDWIEDLAIEEEKVNNNLPAWKSTTWTQTYDGWKVTIDRFKKKNIWQNTYNKIERKFQQEIQKQKSSRRMLNDVERSKKWNQSMAASANSIF